jgi:hypothetical protein
LPPLPKHPLTQAASKTVTDRSSLLDAAFHSPAATADLSIRHRSQVNAPGLHLQSDFEILI